MSPAEILHRAAEQGKRAGSRRRTYSWEAFATGAGRPAILPGLRDAVIANASEPLRRALAASVDAILAGRFSALGVVWPERDPADLFPAISWRLDPVTRQTWPGAERFCFDVGYRHQRELGDVKYVWEFNRLQQLQPLAAAVALWSDERALSAVRSALDSWYAANPPFRGLGWSSGIEVALRAVSILVASSLCGDALGTVTQVKVRTLLRAHLYWIRRFPSRFSSANNHLVAEAMGEFLVAKAMPEMPGSRLAAAQARAVLEREATLQILDDGTAAEQSPTYGAFTAEMLLFAAAVARNEGRPLDPVVDMRLDRFAGFIAALAGPDGSVPAIGDDDEGRVLTLAGRREAAYPTSIAASIAGYLGRPAVGPTSPEPELRDAVFAAPAGGSHVPDGVKTFPSGGITVVRDIVKGRALHLVIDHGPLGYLSIAAHGHADANSLVLSLDGEPILVDPGTYLYHSGGKWRDWFRGTRAHNTLSVGAADQSVISGPFNWSQRARASLDKVQGGREWSVDMRHDGYRARFGVDHARRIQAAEDGAVIIDRLLPARSEIDVELVFQFAPSITLERTGDGWVATQSGIRLLRLRIEPQGQVALVAGGPEQSGGWVSPAFNVKVPAPRLTWRGTMPETGLRTRLIIEPP